MSSFHGLEMAKQALFAQQSALYTTGHNISNANTEGYSRQRVNFNTMSPYPAPGRNRPEMPGQMGTGVKVGTIERVRNKFLDLQFRAENSKVGYWDAKADALGRMEELLNEPSKSGLSHTMSQFWQSLQDLSADPTNDGARSVVANRGLAVAETFNHLSKNLHSIRTDLKDQIDTTVLDANSLLRQINEINEQVQKVEPHGYLPNDLYDERDRLIDELSQIVNIDVQYDKSSKSSLDIAQGIATIEVVDAKGNSLENGPVYLLDGKQGYENAVNEIELNVGDDGVTSVKAGGADIEISPGSLKGLIESHDEVYPEMIAELDKMAFEFAKAFNEVHRDGQDLDKNAGKDFFDGIDFEGDDHSGAAGSITVNKEILKDPDLIAASGDGTAGNGDHALALGDVFDEKLAGLGEKSVTSYFQTVIGKLGVSAQEANRNAKNTAVLQSQVENQRMSVSAVSLDEEMTNMIKFQHAYNAAARSMTTIDEMIDRIINGMGLVGR